MVKYLSTDPNAGLEKPVKYLSMDPMAGLDLPKEEPKSSAYRFVHGMADTLNPVSMIRGLGDMAGRGLAAVDNKGLIGASVDAAKSAVDAQSRGFVNAWDLAGEGRTTEALGQAVSGALPVIGPMARDLGEEAARTGDLATAMGRGVGLGVAPRVISNAPGVVGAVARPLAAAAAKAAPAIAAGAGTAALATVAGASAPAAILAGLTGAIAEKVILPGKLAAAQRLVSWLKGEGSVATPAEIAAKAEKAGLAEELKALKQQNAVEDIATKAEINRQRVMAQQDARAEASAAKPSPPSDEMAALRQESAVENKATRAEIQRQRVMAQMDARRAEGRPKQHQHPPKAPAQAPTAPIPPKPVAVAPEAHPAPVEARTVTAKAEAAQSPTDPTLDPIMMPAKNDAGVGPRDITAKLQDHPAYKELIDKVRGKSQEEALQILADAELKDWLIRPTMEAAGLEAPSPKAVRGAVEAVKDRKWDEWQLTARDVGEGEVVIRPHPGQASPAFVNDRLKYLQEQAAKRGSAPEQFKAQVEANKGKGAELAAALEQPEAPKPTARQQGEALHAKAKARAKKGSK